MKLSEIINILSAEIHTNPEKLDINMNIEYCKASDLLSDVLRYPVDNGILLTGLVNSQVIRTAEMMDIKAVVLVRDKKPSPEMIELADKNYIPLLSTKYKLFKCCGLLYNHGING